VGRDHAFAQVVLMIADPQQYQLASVMLAVTYAIVALVWLVVQERTRTNLAVTVIVLGIAAAFGTTMFVVDQVDPAHPGWFARIQGVGEGSVFLGAGFYLLGLLNETGAGERARRYVRASACAGWLLGATLVTLGAVLPAQRLNDYELSLFEPHALNRPGFWVFASLFLASMVVYLPAWTVIARAGLDRPEQIRGIAVTVATGTSVLMTAVPPLVSVSLGCLWFASVLFGLVSFVAARARRSVFLENFLSPQVVQRVNARGMTATMRPHLADITVVCADLRGFTAYSEGVPSQAVVDLLAEYYDAVGHAASAHGATITSYAGDGVLMLVGAPIANPDHAATGVRLARSLQDSVAPVIERWTTQLHGLGLGIGVASGKVTVGAIEAQTRLEYTAIGTAVNLSARLCAKAGAGQILCDSETALSAGDPDVQEQGHLEIKGFTEPQPVFAVG
jgi:adenylate cyclase